jgi:uncharacterized protein (DUF924 family)
MLPYQVALIDPGASRHAGNWHAAGKAVGNVNLDWVRDYWAGKPLLPPWQDFLLPLNITGLVPATSAGRTERKMDHAKPLPGPETVLAFWRAAGPEKWYAADAAFDAQVRTRFLAVYEAAAAGHLAWDDTPEGALALLVVLDQFPRNMFRGSARAFAADALARKVAARAIDRGFDQGFAPPERCLFYLPFEHSESLADQERCVALNRATGDADAVKWAELHADIIRRFGRFPHRNRALGRATTPEEQAFLDGGGFAG